MQTLPDIIPRLIKVDTKNVYTCVSPDQTIGIAVAVLDFAIMVYFADRVKDSWMPTNTVSCPVLNDSLKLTFISNDELEIANDKHKLVLVKDPEVNAWFIN